MSGLVKGVEERQIHNTEGNADEPKKKYRTKNIYTLPTVTLKLQK